MTKFNIVFFMISKENSLVKDLTELYTKSENVNLKYTSDPIEAFKIVNELGNGIVLFNIAAKEDLSNALALLKLGRKQVKSGFLKPVAIIEAKNSKIDKVLNKFGCVDLLQPNINNKTFRFKIDFWIRGIQNLYKKAGPDSEVHSKQSSFRPNITKDFNFIDPLELESDMWLIKSKADYKKILHRFLLRVKGPSPYIGQWKEIESDDSGQRWEYNLKDKTDLTFVSDSGVWCFDGPKPEFDWKVNKWSFFGEELHLFFKQGDGQIVSKIKFEDGGIFITENSHFALEKEPAMDKSFENEVFIEGEGEKIDTKQEAEIETEHIDMSAMRGETDVIDDDHLSGDVEDNFNNISTISSGNNAFNEKADEVDNLLGGGLIANSSDDTDEFDDLLGGDLIALSIEDILDEFEDIDIENINLESGDIKVFVSLTEDSEDDITFVGNFDDYFEDELAIKVPINSLIKDTKVDVDMTLSYAGKKIKMDITGYIAEVEKMNEEVDLIIIKMDNVDEEKFTDFLNLYQERQSSIHDFMKVAKGY